jgi:hypothetical protein
MAGTPSKHNPSLIRDFGQPRKFLRDMRAKISSRAKSRKARRP